MRSFGSRLRCLVERRTRSVCAVAFLVGVAVGQSPVATAAVFTILQLILFVGLGYLAYDLWCFHRDFGFKWLPGGGHGADE